jgi:hypothetical protein
MIGKRCAWNEFKILAELMDLVPLSGADCQENSEKQRKLFL